MSVVFAIIMQKLKAFNIPCILSIVSVELVARYLIKRKYNLRSCTSCSK